MFSNEKTYKKYIEGMDKYIQDLTDLKKIDPEKAKRQAEYSLKRSGILNCKGKIKDKICE